jgi:ribonuclease P protein component
MSGGGESRFPPTMRLKRRNDFGRVYQDGVVRKGRAFTLHVLARPEGKRLGITIPRSWGSAVERNRMKRKLREAFRQSVDLLPDADIIVRPSVAGRREPVSALAKMLVDGVCEAVRREVSE